MISPHPRKRIGILTGGGDVPPLNALIQSVCETAAGCGMEAIGFLKGWEGLFSDHGFVSLNAGMIDSGRGGTWLKSSRVNILKVENGPKRVLERLESLGIDALIVVGGDDTLSNSLALNHFPQILISKTIDNDVGRVVCSDSKACEFINYFTLGYPSAVRKIVSYVGEEGLRTTAYSHERIIVVESMGMHAGWLALASSLGKPDFILIPEFPLDYERFKATLSELYHEQKHVIVTVAEGARWEGGAALSADDRESDAFGHPRFRGSAERLCMRLKGDLSSSFDTRNVNFVNPSYLYRSGRPCDLDASWARKLGRESVKLVQDGLDKPVFLSIQRSKGTFHIEPYPLEAIRSIEDFHRFVTEAFYNPVRFSATDLAIGYLETFMA